MMFSRGLDLATKQSKALEFLNDVGKNADIFEFREKIRMGGYLRAALISHLENLFALSVEEIGEVIEKFLGGVTYYEHSDK